MKISNPKDLKNKDLIVFDLDGTLTPSKFTIDKEMSELFVHLTHAKKVAVISGGELKQYKIQLLFPLKGKGVNLKNLFLFPTNATVFYMWNRAALKKIYAFTLKPQEVKQIKQAFEQAFAEIKYKQPTKTYGPEIENRGTQVSFSALGQKVVTMLGKKGVALKEQWQKTQDVRPTLAKALASKLPKFTVRVAGVTTIDVVRKGVDKAYGIRQIEKRLKVPIKKMLFVGDAIEPGKNDYEAIKTGIDYVAVSGPEETKKLIRKLL
jgi:phosphomannomutase